MVSFSQFSLISAMREKCSSLYGNFINTFNFTQCQSILLFMMLMVLLFNGEPSKHPCEWEVGAKYCSLNAQPTLKMQGLIVLLNDLQIKLHIFCQDEFESEDIEHVTVDKKQAFNKFKGKYLDSDSTGLKNCLHNCLSLFHVNRKPFKIYMQRTFTTIQIGRKSAHLSQIIKYTFACD